MTPHYQSKGSAHVVIVVCLVIALIGALGVVFYQNVIQKRADQNTTATTDGTKSASTATQTGQAVSLKQFTSQKHLVRFTYPSAWSLTEVVNTDQSDWYSSAVTIKNEKGVIVAQLGTGGQFGGACDPEATMQEATTVMDNTVTVKGLSTAHVGYTIVRREDALYDVFYGLNKGDLPLGTKQVQCPGMAIGYSYIVNASDSAVGAVTFGTWAVTSDYSHIPFKTLDEAKAYANSSEMKEIISMISSLSVGE